MGHHRFDAVLFDMDGVLVDSEPWWNEARVAFAASLGKPWTHEDQAACMGGNSLEWAGIMQDRLGLASMPVEAIRDAIVPSLAALDPDRLPA